MQNKEYTLTLDMMRLPVIRPFEVVQGDTGNILNITLENNGVAMDLSACDIMIVFASAKGVYVQDLTTGVTRGEETGSLTVALSPDSYGPGNVQADIQVYSGADQSTLVTSMRFDFRCRQSLLTEEAIRTDAGIPAMAAATQTALAAAEAALAAGSSVTVQMLADNGVMLESVYRGASAATVKNAEKLAGQLPAAFAAAAHTHGSLTADGKLGTASGKLVETGAGGALTSGRKLVASATAVADAISTYGLVAGDIYIHLVS